MTIHGNKTYGTIALAIVTAWIAHLFEMDMGEGPVTLQTAVEITVAGLTAAFIRHGIATGATSGRSAAPLVLAALIVMPACSARYEPNERGAKLAYADGLEAMTAAKTTTIRLATAGVLDAGDIVAIDTVLAPADRSLEAAWARIQAGDYSQDTFDLLDIVLDAAEQVAFIHAAQEQDDGSESHHGDRGDGPAAHRSGDPVGRAGPAGWQHHRRAA